MERKPRVGVGLEPFMLRSAVAHHLSRSGGFQVSLLDPLERGEWPQPDAVIVSAPVDLPDSVVIVVSPSTDLLEVHSRGRTRSVPYRGLSGLTSLILDELPA